METVQRTGNGGGLTGNALKLIAIAAMTLDHVLWILFPGYQHMWWLLALHAIGRITAPIMWFFIAEGYLHTHDFKKYALRHRHGRTGTLGSDRNGGPSGRLLVQHFARVFCADVYRLRLHGRVQYGRRIIGRRRFYGRGPEPSSRTGRYGRSAPVDRRGDVWIQHESSFT